MPNTTALDKATAMIEKAWGRPIDDLEALAVRRPNNDPLGTVQSTALSHIRW